MRPPHLVLAIGIFGAPKIPTLPGLADFTGEVIHAADYRDGARWAGRKVVVLGTGNSGHDVAQDLHAWGAEVTLVQRGSTTVLSVVPSQADSEAIFDEGPAEDIDLLVAATPLPDLEQASRLSAEHSQENDADLLAGLSRIGFRLDFGADGTGSSMKYLRSGGGYYLNVGCSELLVEGEIALAHWEDVATFVDDGLHMKDGAGIPADLVVLATGYEPLSEYLCTTLGPETSAKVGAIWGFGQDAELRNVWRPTAQDGLWIMAGNFQQCRFFSRLLALQLKARLDGVRL